jgi:hypothetical protein
MSTPTAKTPRRWLASVLASSTAPLPALPWARGHRPVTSRRPAPVATPSQRRAG